MTDCKILLTDEMITNALLEEREQILAAFKLCKKKTYLFDSNVDMIVAGNLSKKYVTHDGIYFLSDDMKKIIEKNKIIVDKIVSALL
jgi:hypothetical protein